MNNKILLASLLLLFVIFSCKKDDDDDEPFDHAAQAIIDDDVIREFLETHFYTPAIEDESFGVIDTILNGETPLIDVVTIQNETFDDISYKLYVLKEEPVGVGISPSRVDSVLVQYKGITVDNSKEQFDERINFTWLNLPNTITGWSRGFVNYKSGVNTSLPDQPLTFEETGKGVLFIPSGLAYRELGTATGSLANTPIYFHINLGQVEEIDHDLDGISSRYEDINGDGDVVNDDTDNDDTPNFVDSDDDGDGVLTKDENPDPNGDGNPSDAKDTDGDNVPDYLDADTN